MAHTTAIRVPVVAELNPDVVGVHVPLLGERGAVADVAGPLVVGDVVGVVRSTSLSLVLDLVITSVTGCFGARGVSRKYKTFTRLGSRSS